MNILVFGGTFSPPHLGHQLMVEQVLLAGLAQQLWLLPVGQHSFAKLAPYRQERLAMLELLRHDITQAHPALADKIKVNTYELDRDEESQTYRTLSALSAAHPEHHFGFLIGSDNLAAFDQWHHHQELLAQFPVLVYPRTGFPLQPLLPGMTVLTQLPQLQVSSTLVRQAIQQGAELQGLLSAAMIDFLQQHEYMYQ